MAPEKDEELQALESWYKMLEEGQRTAAICHLIQYTTLAQAQFFLEVLKLRELELEVYREMQKDWIRGQYPDNCAFGGIDVGHSLTLGNSSRVSMPAYCLSQSDALRQLYQQFEGKSPLRPSNTAQRFSNPAHRPPNARRPTIASSPLRHSTDRSSTPQATRSPGPAHPYASLPYTTPTPFSPPLTFQKTTLLTLYRLTISPTFPSFPPPIRDPHSHTQNTRKRKITIYPQDSTDPDWLLKWLKSLRLHKYAGKLQGMSPRELLELGEEDLLCRGVDTVGARRKLVVAFREAKESSAPREVGNS